MKAITAVIAVSVTAALCGFLFYFYKRRNSQPQQQPSYYNISPCAPNTGKVVTSPAATDEPNTGSADAQETNNMYEEVGGASGEAGCVDDATEAAYYAVTDVDRRVADQLDPSEKRKNKDKSTQPDVTREAEEVMYVNVGVDHSNRVIYEQLTPHARHEQINTEYQQLKYM